MSHFARLAYTDEVQVVQAEQGSLEPNLRRLHEAPDAPDVLGEREKEFVERLDGFYLSTVNQHGWPYIQFKGGPPGFVHVLDSHRLAIADVRGNRQYLSTGNLRGRDKVALFFMEYATQTRMKLLGRAWTMALEDDPGLTAAVCAGATDGRPERLLVVEAQGIAWNCSQHIPVRLTVDEIETGLGELRRRIEDLERENGELRRAVRGAGVA